MIGAIDWIIAMRWASHATHFAGRRCSGGVGPVSRVPLSAGCTMDPMTSLDADLVHRWFSRLRDPDDLAMPRWGIVPTEQEATAFAEGEVQIEFAVQDLPPPRMVAPLSEVPARLLRTYLQALAAGISGTRQLLTGSAGMSFGPAGGAAGAAGVVGDGDSGGAGCTVGAGGAGRTDDVGRAGESVGPTRGSCRPGWGCVVPAARSDRRTYGPGGRSGGLARSVIPTHWRWSPA